MSRFKVEAEIDANTSGFDRAMGRMGRSVDAMKKKFGGLRGAIGSALAVAGGGAYGAMIERRNAAVDAIRMTSNVPLREAQFANFVAERAGMEGRDILGIFRDIEERRRDALAGNKGLQEAFRGLGIDTISMRNRQAPDLFFQMMDAIEKAAPGKQTQQRLVNISEITDDQTSEMLAPLFRRLGTDRLREEFLRSGHNVTAEMMEDDRRISQRARQGRDVFGRIGRFGYGAIGGVADFVENDVPWKSVPDALKILGDEALKSHYTPNQEKQISLLERLVEVAEREYREADRFIDTIP